MNEKLDRLLGMLSQHHCVDAELIAKSSARKFVRLRRIFCCYAHEMGCSGREIGGFLGIDPSDAMKHVRSGREILDHG